MRYGNVIIDVNDAEYRAELLCQCEGINRSDPRWARMRTNHVYNIMLKEYESQIVHLDTDIFKLATDLFYNCGTSEKIRIVAPGPGMHDCSDEMMFTILCNKAIELVMDHDSRPLCLWMVADDAAKKCDWFKRGMELRFDKERGIVLNTCFDYMCLRDIKSEYTIEVPSNLPPDPIEKLYKNIILNGATISGMALQVAYHLGARVIEMCGVPMTGDKYHDGTRVRGHHNLNDFRLRMNQMIKIMQSKGVEIYSMNETTLDIEVRI